MDELLRGLDEPWFDRALLLVIADRCEEEGNLSLARGWRRAHHLKKAPFMRGTPAHEFIFSRLAPSHAVYEGPDDLLDWLFDRALLYSGRTGGRRRKNKLSFRLRSDAYRCLASALSGDSR